MKNKKYYTYDLANRLVEMNDTYYGFIKSYTYDAMGNIQTITEGSTLKATYHYDELSQLIREDNVDLNKTITYTYDLGGNITTKTEYPYTIGTPNSTRDLLNPDGTIKQRKYYGPDGKASKDTDYNHSGEHEFPHDHEWDWSKTPPRQKSKDTSKKITSGLIIGGKSYFTYRIIRMIPSLFCPPTMIPNAMIP